MTAVRKLQQTPQNAELVRGTVSRIEGKAIFVRAPSGLISARRAASCLLEPMEGDRVLVACEADETPYVLAVLERDEKQSAKLAFESDVSIEARGGRIGLTSSEGIDLVGRKDTQILTGELSIHAVKGSVLIQSLSYLGTALRSEVEKVKSIAASIETVAERMTARVKRSYRFVEELDQVKAQQIDMTSQEVMTVKTRNMSVVAEELVKIDGGQIQLG
jgi:hypothetical protein